MSNVSTGEMMIVEHEVDGRTVIEFHGVSGRPQCDLEDVEALVGWLRAAGDRRDSRLARRQRAAGGVPTQRGRGWGVGALVQVALLARIGWR